MSKIQPGREPHQWAAFNVENGKLLSKPLNLISFLLLWGGSVYGFHAMFEQKFNGMSLFAAAGIALLLQLLAIACMPFAARLIPALFMLKLLKTNQHFRMTPVSYITAVVCVLGNFLIFRTDFIANSEANEKMAKEITEKPSDVITKTDAEDKALSSAEKALAAATTAYENAKSVHAAKVDADINGQKRTLQSRLGQLSGKIGEAAQNERNLLTRRIAGLEEQRKSKKASFQSKAYDDALATYNGAANRHGENVEKISGVTRSLNDKNRAGYDEKLDRRENGLFYLYLAGFVFMVISQMLRAYRAIRFDEKHPESPYEAIGNAFSAITENILKMFETLVWNINAKLAEWLPETTLETKVKEEVIAILKEPGCISVFRYISQNPGVSEAAIYMAHQGQVDPMQAREYLRAMKTFKIAFENRGHWTVDEIEAKRFFFDVSEGEKSPVKNSQNINNQQVDNTEKNRNFEGSKFVDAILDLINDLRKMAHIFENKAPVEGIILDLQKLITTA